MPSITAKPSYRLGTQHLTCLGFEKLGHTGPLPSVGERGCLETGLEAF